MDAPKGGDLASLGSRTTRLQTASFTCWRQQRALEQQDHRPWAVPDRPWMLAQSWHATLFAHWRVPYDVLREIVPPVIPLDTFDGESWVGVTPFAVTATRMRWTPPMLFLSSFPEVNVRTYVTLDGKPGIYFLSLDADSRLTVMGARRSHRIPYFKADMSVQRRDGWVLYESRRESADAPAAELEAEYRGTGPTVHAEPGTLDHWLTERYCLYTVNDEQRPLRGEIHHRPWSLQAAEARIGLNTMTEQWGIELAGEPLLHYSPRQDTLMWGLQAA